MELDPALCRQAMLARDARFDGRFFTAVKTTGIYCRPICPARPPKPESCVFLPTAAAAQAAGFRPCLRCRPETAPGLGAWRGTSNTVSRALALIDAGALDGCDVNALANRLGVGDRQLRRLFMRHLGASPVVVAQTRRVLLAKQLLHETDLTMAEIALASGFGSVRRFNEAFQDVFARPPAALRGKRDAARGGPAIVLSLSYRPPFDWDVMLGFLAPRATPGVESVIDGVYRRSIELGGLAGTIAVANDPARCRLRARIRLPRMDALPTIIARLRRMFDLSADPAVIGAALSRDARLAACVAARPGLRVPGVWDGFELGVQAIAGQHIPLAVAARHAGAIARMFGQPLAPDVAEPGLTHTFPQPGRLAGASIACVPAQCARAIAAFAEAAVNPLLFDRDASLAGTIRRLRALSGIGEWTAHYIAMRALREPDAFPEADIGLLRAMDQGSRRLGAAELRARAEAWRPWRAYAAMHLWAAAAPHAFDAATQALDALVA